MDDILNTFFRGKPLRDPRSGRDITESVLRKVRALRRARQKAREEEIARSQLAIGRANLAAPPKPLRKLGARRVMALDPRTYWHWVRREGRECWADKGFRNDILRDNPQCGVPTDMEGAPVSMALTAPPRSPRRVKFHKNYG